VVDIIRREVWGARYADGFRPAPIPAARVWLHHSVTSAGSAGSSRAIDDLSVRQLEVIGQGRFGRGISYTYAVTPSGRVYEGHSVDRQGAHTGGDNTHSRGIVLVGNYDVARPSPQQLASVAELLVYGFLMGYFRAPALTGGHRDAPNAATACPGRHGQAAIASINRTAAALMARPQNGAPELNAEETRMLAELHDVLVERRLDYRAHGPGPVNDLFGTVMGLRQDVGAVAATQPQVGAQLADVQQRLGQVARQLQERPVCTCGGSRPVGG
jgi:hypothetical protein